MKFEEFWEKEAQKRYPIGDTRWTLDELKELAKCTWDACAVDKKEVIKSLVMAQYFCEEDNCTLCRNAIEHTLDILNVKKVAQGSDQDSKATQRSHSEICPHYKVEYVGVGRVESHCDCAGKL